MRIANIIPWKLPRFAFANDIGGGAPSAPRMSPDFSPRSSDTSDAQVQADNAMLQRIARGDRDALAAFYDRYSRPLFGTAFRILNDTTEAEDVVHDAFVTIWRKSGEFEASRGTAFSWAIALVRNRAIDRVRSRRRRGELLDQSAPADLGYTPSAEQNDSNDDLFIKEKAAAVRAAVGELAPEQRDALEMAFFTGLTQQEIAAKLQEPLGTIKARIRRGLFKLRDRLAQRL